MSEQNASNDSHEAWNKVVGWLETAQYKLSQRTVETKIVLWGQNAHINGGSSTDQTTCFSCLGAESGESLNAGYICIRICAVHKNTRRLATHTVSRAHIHTQVVLVKSWLMMTVTSWCSADSRLVLLVVHMICSFELKVAVGILDGFSSQNGLCETKNGQSLL